MFGKLTLKVLELLSSTVQLIKTHHFIGDRDNWFPFNEKAAVEDFCPRLRQANQIIKAYARKCFKPFPKQVIGLLIYGSSKETKIRCDTEQGRAKCIGHVQCTKDQNHEPTHLCMDTFIRSLESVRDTMDDKDLKIPYSCCLFHEFRDCVGVAVQKYCGQKHVTYLNVSIAAIVDDMFDLTCTNYEYGNANCNKLPSIKLASNKISKSFLPPIVDIFTNL